jgi:hypothetical protein
LGKEESSNFFRYGPAKELMLNDRFGGRFRFWVAFYAQLLFSPLRAEES